jgi:hypothetical protein
LFDLRNKDSIPAVAGKKERSLTPLLVVVFLASYGLMTLLIVDQGETIQAQKNFINVLLGDSRELWAMKGKAQVDRFAQAQAEAQKHGQPLGKTVPPADGQVPFSQSPSTQIPKAPSARIPSNQIQQPQLQNRTSKTAKPENRAPETQVPPVPASDLGDQRRVLRTL